MDVIGRAADAAPAVKVCGLTDAEEAQACAELGVWGIGVVFAASARRVTPERAREVLAGLPASVARVGVFVDPEPEAVAVVVRTVGLTHVQVHGRGDPDAVRAACGVPVIEGVRVDGPPALARARTSRADMVLLDAAVHGVHGGTGTAFDWGLLEAREPVLDREFGVAGGLHPGNVAEAVRRLRPALVDVSSGVESAPGRKDVARVAAFVAAARARSGAAA